MGEDKITYSVPATSQVGTSFIEMMFRGAYRHVPPQYDLKKLFQEAFDLQPQKRKKYDWSGNPHTDIKNGVSAFFSWRRAHEWDFWDVARKLPTTPARYSQIEKGKVNASFEEMKALCRLFQLHPVETINFETDLITPDEIHLALDAYKNPASYNFTHADCQWDLRDALDQWCEKNSSYDNLEDYRDELQDENDPDNIGLIILLSRLLVNDGNKAMGMNGVMAMVDHAPESLTNIAKSYEARVKTILDNTKTLADIANEQGKRMFAHRWNDYRNFTLGLLQQAEEGLGSREFAHDMFMKDIPILTHEGNQNQKEELFALLITIGKKHGEGTNFDQKSALAARQAEKILNFVTENHEWLTQYAIRQAILTQTDLGTIHDDPDDDLYMHTSHTVVQTNSTIIGKMFVPK